MTREEAVEESRIGVAVFYYDYVVDSLPYLYSHRSKDELRELLREHKLFTFYELAIHGDILVFPEAFAGAEREETDEVANSDRWRPVLPKTVIDKLGELGE